MRYSPDDLAVYELAQDVGRLLDAPVGTILTKARERLADALNAAAGQAPQWTRTTPTRPGTYWCAKRLTAATPIHIARVFLNEAPVDDDGEPAPRLQFWLTGNDMPFELDGDFVDLWLGPIEPPPAPEGM